MRVYSPGVCVANEESRNSEVFASLRIHYQKSDYLNGLSGSQMDPCFGLTSRALRSFEMLIIMIPMCWKVNHNDSDEFES